METLNDRISLLVGSFAERIDRPDYMLGFAELSDTPLVTEDGFARAIVIAAPMKPEVVAEVSAGPTLEYYNETVELQSALNDIAYDIVNLIHDSGCRARALIDDSKSGTDGIAKTTDRWKQMKKIATRAAIGWVGKNGLIVTKRFGSTVLLSVVYTDAPLECSQETFLSRCARCTECVYECPAGAISGIDWKPNDNYDTIVDRQVCADKCKYMSKRMLGFEANVCGICAYACPYTKAYIARKINR